MLTHPCAGSTEAADASAPAAPPAAAARAVKAAAGGSSASGFGSLLVAAFGPGRSTTRGGAAGSLGRGSGALRHPLHIDAAAAFAAAGTSGGDGRRADGLTAPALGAPPAGPPEGLALLRLAAWEPACSGDAPPPPLLASDGGGLRNLPGPPPVAAAVAGNVLVDAFSSSLGAASVVADHHHHQHQQRLSLDSRPHSGTGAGTAAGTRQALVAAGGPAVQPQPLPLHGLSAVQVSTAACELLHCSGPGTYVMHLRSQLAADDGLRAAIERVAT